MKKNRLLLAVVCNLLIALPITLSAQTSTDLCQDVLHLAFYDRAYSLETSKSSVAWRAWACSASESQTKSASSLSATIPIPEADMIVGTDASSASEEKWKKKYCSDEQLSTADEKMVWQQRETVSRYMRDAIGAWESCMKSKESSYETQQFSVRLRPASDYSTSGIVQVDVSGHKVGTSDPPRMKVTIEGAECPKNDGWLDSDEVAASNSFKCTRIVSNTQCPPDSVGRIGFAPLSVEVDYAYNLYQRYINPRRASLSLVPAVKATCQCGGDDGWAPDFSSDPDNCGTCGRSCGTGTSRKCTAGACSVCQFQGPDAIGKPSSSQFSCKMKPNANVIVEVKGDVHYVKNVYGIEGPPMGGDVAEKLVTSSLSFSSTSIPLTHSVPGPGAQNTQTKWSNSSGVVLLDNSGIWNGSLNMGECFWGSQLQCDLSRVNITVTQQP